MKILDATLRDGGYYTNWDFDKMTVDRYLQSMNHLPIDYLEIGYRNKLKNAYHGKYFYMPIYELEDIRKKTNKKISIILMEDDVKIEDLPELLTPIQGLADMIRIAFGPKHIKFAIDLAREVKKYGFEVGFNVMYMSEWLQDLSFFDDLVGVDKVADVFYMVDSFGGVFPEDVRKIVEVIRSKTNCPLGFHGHDNLHMALANALTALDSGVEYIDATVLGMGRGAGNLIMELFLTVMNNKRQLPVDFYELERVVSTFTPLWKEHLWGSNLPYMVAGVNSFSQGKVMDWETNPFYNYKSILQALNTAGSNEDYKEFSVKTDWKSADKVLLVGNGPSVINNINGLKTFLEKHPEMVIIHTNTQFVPLFNEFPHTQYFSLVGREGRRLERALEGKRFSGTCIITPQPGKTGTYIPESLKSLTEKIDALTYDEGFLDQQSVLALQIAEKLGAKEVYLTGYDGAAKNKITLSDFNLLSQTENLLLEAKKRFSVFESLTETNYDLPNNANLFYQLRK